MTVSSGTVTLVPPTITIDRTKQEEVIDGVKIVFQMTPGTEAPSEMNFYFPQRRALCIAEIATHSLHNILTPRGAVVRDARAWSRYLDEAVILFTRESDVLFGSHTWPTWGHDAIVRLLSEQRDIYGYLHDQTLRMINQGMTGAEIAEEIVLPDALQKAWHAQGFYGSVSFNVKAIYQSYMGWFDGNPAHLWEHPPVQAAQRYVSCMGGVEEVIRKAEGFARDGDLRFAATLLSHAVFADSKHSGAQQALANVFDRLGQGAENGIWRNFYLTGALELRTRPRGVLSDFENLGMMTALSVEQLLDSLAIRLDGPRAQTESFTLDIRLTDLNERHWVTLSNGFLVHRQILPSKDPMESEDASFGCELTHLQLLHLLGKQSVPKGVKEWGDSEVLHRLFSYLGMPDRAFPIVMP